MKPSALLFALLGTCLACLPPGAAQARRPLWKASRTQAPKGAPVRPTPDGPARMILLPPGSDTRPDEPYSFEKGGKETPEEFLGNPYFLGFAGGLYRPPVGERIGRGLALRVQKGPRPGEDPLFTYAYVMFQGRITEAKKRSVESLGVKLLFYHPNNSYAAKIPVHIVGDLAARPCVRWVGFARPVQKIHPALDSVMSETPSGQDIPIYIDLFESDLNPKSEKLIGSLPQVATIGRGVRPGDPAYAAWSWKTHGRIQEKLEKLGVKVGAYHEEIHAYEAKADAWTILELVDLDWVAFLEWRSPVMPMHDRVIPQVGADYYREIYKATTVTVGVIDTGFHLANGGYNGHIDLSKQAVGWNFWPGGGCGSPYCDEASQGYHGTHVLGTVCGEGRARIKYRGTSPYLGWGPATHRLFLAKGLTTNAFQVMRKAFKDPWNNVTPRPVLVTNSWGGWGCLNNCTKPAYWVGSEAGPRTCDAEVYNQNQLYIFAAGNHGGAGGGNYVAGTIIPEATGKNILAVGMCRDGNRTTPPAGGPGSIVSWSSHGPCGDGRWKPNVSAPGCVTMSTAGGTRTGYKPECGTSMSAPVVAGIMASAAERYSTWLPKSAPLMRVWAMATAVTRNDAAPSGSWGRLPSSHLNSHGMGRISALKALNGGGSLPWTRTWANPTLSGNAYFDITVGSGATRLLVVLTWDDPPASPGAKPAAVNDFDLWLDRAPFTSGTNTGEYKSTSSIDTVEHIIVNNPPAGKYRVKIFAYKLSGNARVGVMVVQIFGDTTPPGALTLTPDRKYIRPGQTVNLTVSAKSDSYIATNTFVKEGSHTGFTRTGSSLKLKDGVTVSNPHDATGDQGVQLGDIVKGQTRSVVYGYKETAGTDAVRYLYFSGLSDNWGARSSRAAVIVDGTPPFSVRNLKSATHTPNVWSNQSKIVFTWTAAYDNLSGIDGYSILTRFGSAAFPDAIKDIGALTSWTGNYASSTQPYYFSIRSLDRSGNWGNSYSWTGPYYIDTVQPGLVANLRSTTHSKGTWSRNPKITFKWTAAQDAHSGIDGYGILFSDDKPARPGAIKKIGAVTTTTATLATSSHAWYFNIRSTDKAKNWDDQWVSSGPYWIDSIPPAGVSLKIDNGAAGTSSTDVTLTITASDAHSGLADMRFMNDGGSWSPWFRFATSRSWKLTDYGGSSSLGTRTVVMEVRDRAGNPTRVSDKIYFYKKVVYFGSACSGAKGVPSFTIGGIPGLGQSVSFKVGNTGAPVGALFFGVSRTSWLGLPLPLDLKIIGVPSCFLNISLDALLYSGAPGALHLNIPKNQALVGIPMNFQWLLLGDPSGKAVVTTGGAAMVLGGL